jgi:hypothetical protein
LKFFDHPVNGRRWNVVNNWLERFAHQQDRPFVIIYHANREGKDMRGTSKRKDLAD